MYTANDFLQYHILGNSIESYLWFAGILTGGILLKQFISKLISRLLFAALGRKTRSVGLETFLNLLTAPISVFILVITFYLAFSRLSFPEEWHLSPENVFGVRMVIYRIFKVAIIISVVWIVLRLVDFIASVVLHHALHTQSKMESQLVLFTKEVSKVVIAATGFFAALAIGFNLDVVSLVTGLGIGGLAFALAAKETLENLLGSFTIFLDRPFKVGDQIRVSGVEGTVESVGIRTTRLRSMDKSLVILPNKKMIDAELVNEDERALRRVRFTIGLNYGTTAEQLQNVSNEIKMLIHNHHMVNDNVSVNFRTFGTNSLDILINYFIKDPAYEKFLEVNEEINLKIIGIVERNGCTFGLPSGSDYLARKQTIDANVSQVTG